MDSVDRFLALVVRSLSARDAWVQYGGRDPSSPRVLTTALDDGWQLVATFAAPIEDRPDMARRLEALANGFTSVIGEGGPRVPPVTDDSPARRELDRLLDVLVEASAAAASIVVDDRSPAIWGASTEARAFDDISQLEAAAGDEPPSWLPALARATAQARGSDEASTRNDADDHWAIRPVGGIYRLLLVFGRAFSELPVEARLARALPVIERQILSLPPRDPTPAGRVIRMWPRG